MTRVSVVIPCFNHGRFLAGALDSVLGQTRRPEEVVVVDDGSEDDSREVARSYGSRVRLLQRAHGGAGAARNAGASETTGDVIAFLDADDAWAPTKLEKQVALLEHRREAAGSFTWTQAMDRSGRMRERYEPSDQDLLARLLRRGNVLFGAASTAVVRRTAFDGTQGFDPELQYCEDWDLWIRIVARAPLLVVPEVLAFHRVSTGSHRLNLAKMEWSLRRTFEKARADPLVPQDLKRRSVPTQVLVSSMWRYARGGRIGAVARLAAETALRSPLQVASAAAYGVRRRWGRRRGVVRP